MKCAPLTVSSLVLLWSAVVGFGANLIPNSSFEAGTGKGWTMWKATFNESQYKPDIFINTDFFQHGAHSFQLPPFYKIVTRGTPLKASTSYTFSYYVRSLSGGDLAFNEHFFPWTFVTQPHETARTANGTWQRFTKTFTSTNFVDFYYFGWQSGDWLLVDSIQVEEGSSATTYAPMAQVEAGISVAPLYNLFFAGDTKTLSTKFYNNGASSVESVLQFEVYDLWNRVLTNGFTTNTVAATSRTTNSITLPQTNGWQRVVTRLVNATQAGNDSRDELTITASPKAAVALAYNTNGFFAQHPDADQVALAQALRPSGFTWARAFSPFTGLRHEFIEPSGYSPGSETWPDAEMNRMCTNGVSVLGVLWTGLDTDHWSVTNELSTVAVASGGTGYSAGNTLTIAGGSGTAGTLTVNTVGGGGVITSVSIATRGSYYGTFPSTPNTVTGGAGSGASITLNHDNVRPLRAVCPNINDFSNYCYRVVNHYKGTPWNVKYWEVFNEAQQGELYFALDEAPLYAALLTASCAAIKAADSTANIVAIGGAVDAAWSASVWALLDGTTQGRISAVSCHLYPLSSTDSPMGSEVDSRPAAWATAWAGIRPVWNTESGVWEFGGHFTDVSPFGYNFRGGYNEWERPEETTEGLLNSERLIQMIVRCFGNDFKKFFGYDARAWTEAMIYASTTEGTHSSMWNYNTAIRPKGVAQIICQAMLDESINATQIANGGSGALEMYYFNKASSSNIVVLWKNDRSSSQLTVTNENFAVYDMMGNRLTQPAGKLNVYRQPQYVISTSLDSNQICQTVCFASVAALADTVAPQVSIDIAPSGTWPGGQINYVKWSALDETHRPFGSGNFVTNIDYAWSIVDAGAAPSYSIWSQTSMLSFFTLSATNHALWVKARDAAGNIEEVTYIFDPIGVGAGGGEPPPDPPPGGFSARNGRTRFPLGGFP